MDNENNENNETNENEENNENKIKKENGYSLLKLLELIKEKLFKPIGKFFKKINKSIKKYKEILSTICQISIAVATLSLAFGTFSMASSTLKLSDDNRKVVDSTQQLVLSNKKLVDYTHKANERAEKLFVGQNKPLIDVTPISITQTEDSNAVKHGLTLCSITNYSGFVAYDIVIDLRYGEKNNWISEWLKAENDRKEKEEKKVEKKGVVKVKTFLSAPKAFKPNAVIKELKPGAKGISKHIGLLDLEKTVCNAGFTGHPVFVRVKWENETGHVFDEIHEYKLVCTKTYEGRSFTFIPEGVISHKGKK